jgi:hypothetical protein
MVSHPKSPHAPLIIDLTGLPERVVRQVRQLVEEARRGQTEQEPDKDGGEKRSPLFGRYAHLGITITKEDLDEARREAWANFPREFPEP